MTTTEMTELRRTLGQLRHCVGSLRARYGDTPAVRRLVNDLERMDIDTADIDGMPTPRQGTVPKQESIVVPDTPYDESLWQGADDEGVGGYQRHQR